MIENIIGLAIGLTVAFFCMYFYRRGLKDGMNVMQDKKPEPIIEKPSFLQTTEEKIEKEKAVEESKADREKREQEREFEAGLNALFSYQPKHTAKRGEGN
jgi:hypothetical protein